MSNLQFTLGYKYSFGVAYIMLEEERHSGTRLTARVRIVLSMIYRSDSSLVQFASCYTKVNIETCGVIMIKCVKAFIS